jgi:hypothetical protein
MGTVKFWRWGIWGSPGFRKFLGRWERVWANLAAIATFALLPVGVVTYIYTIKPVFDREKLSQEVEQLKKDVDKSNETLATSMREIDAAKVEREGLKNENAKLVAEKTALTESNRLQGANLVELNRALANEKNAAARRTPAQRRIEAFQVFRSEASRACINPNQSPPSYFGCIEDITNNLPYLSSLDSGDRKRLSEWKETIRWVVGSGYDYLHAARQRFPISQGGLDPDPFIAALSVSLRLKVYEVASRDLIARKSPPNLVNQTQETNAFIDELFRDFGPGISTSPMEISLFVAVDHKVLPPNGTTVFSWSSANATSCKATGDWTSDEMPLSGKHNLGAIPQSSYFGMVCRGPSGSIERGVNVEIK